MDRRSHQTRAASPLVRPIPNRLRSAATSTAKAAPSPNAPERTSARPANPTATRRRPAPKARPNDCYEEKKKTRVRQAPSSHPPVSRSHTIVVLCCTQASPHTPDAVGVLTQPVTQATPAPAHAAATTSSQPLRTDQSLLLLLTPSTLVFDAWAKALVHYPEQDLVTLALHPTRRQTRLDRAPHQRRRAQPQIGPTAVSDELQKELKGVPKKGSDEHRRIHHPSTHAVTPSMTGSKTWTSSTRPSTTPSLSSAHFAPTLNSPKRKSSVPLHRGAPHRPVAPGHAVERLSLRRPRTPIRSQIILRHLGALRLAGGVDPPLTRRAASAPSTT